jgi:metallo-beta-lactamase family protein
LGFRTESILGFNQKPAEQTHTEKMQLIHHGGAEGVTGSCHELIIDDARSLLVDCGLFQGDEAEVAGVADGGSPIIDFPINRVRALLVTHCHLDHAGRIPYLMAAGFSGPIYASEATVHLLPLLLEDALKVGMTRNRALIEAFLQKLTEVLVPVPFGQRLTLWSDSDNGPPVSIRFRPAGHILGSAYIEVMIGRGRSTRKVLFSGDLGAPYTPLLVSPKSPWSTDLLVLESTYGDRLHEGRAQRRKSLRRIIEHCFENRGTVLIPAFSIGRTQELLAEIEQIVFQCGQREAARGIRWEDLDIIVDSPLAARFTEVYRDLKDCWDAEARRKVRSGRHPLSFEQLLTIDTHAEHERTVAYLKDSGRPAIVIAAGGMCNGGRIVNYLKALIEDDRTDILFVGYQARGTPGRIIQQYGPKKGYVILDSQRYDIKAGVYTIGGYSAHADQRNLIRFVKGMRRHPIEIRLVHGDRNAQRSLQKILAQAFPKTDVTLGNKWL